MRISDWSSDVCSSDLADGVALHPAQGRQVPQRQCLQCRRRALLDRPHPHRRLRYEGYREPHQGGGEGRRLRSEEHTSELQSLMRISYAVFCLKKKKQKDNTEN